MRVRFKYYITTTVVLFLIGGCTDKNNQHKGPSDLLDIKAYHAVVSKAEEAIMCKKYIEANALYEKADNYRKNPFASDIYNRILCNHYGGQRDEIFENLKTLVEVSGISINTLNEKYRFLLLYPERWSKFKEWYEQGIQKHIQGLDMSSVKLCKQVQSADQQYRYTEDRYTKFKKQNEEVDSMNSRKLLSFFEENGYPQESEIGVLEVKGKRKGFQNTLKIAVMHLFQNVNQSWSEMENGENIVDRVDRILEKSVHEGKLHPEMYLEFLYGRQVHTNGFGQDNMLEPPVTIIEGNYYIKPIDYERLDSINAVRSAIYLEELELYYAKAIFMAKNQDLGFDLLEQGCCVTYHLKNPDQEIMIAQSFGVIPYLLTSELNENDFCLEQ